MKKISLLFLMLTLVALALAPVTGKVSAQEFPGYETGTQIQNLSDVNDVQVTLEFWYADDGSSLGGTLADTVVDTVGIDSFQSKTYWPTEGFSGSMIVKTGERMGAVANVLNSAKTAGASYVGKWAGSTTVQIPLLMKNNGSNPYNTWFSVQNAGDLDATISIKYTDCASAITSTIKKYSSKTFYQEKETCHTSKVFSAEINSTNSQPLVVVVMEENPIKMLAYTGFASGSTNVVMPLINANNSGIQTGIQIQNTGASDTVVTVTYVPSIAGTQCTETQTIKSKQSATFALAAFVSSVAGENCANGVRFVGSARITQNSTSMPLNAIVNQTKDLYGEAYGAFNPNDGQWRVVMPLLMDRNGTNIYSTGFSVMNVGSASTYVKCTLSNTTKTFSGRLNQYEALTVNMANQISVGYVGSGICRAYTDAAFTTENTAAKLVGVVNELGRTTADRLLVYEAISLP